MLVTLLSHNYSYINHFGQGNRLANITSINERVDSLDIYLWIHFSTEKFCTEVQ